MVRLQSQLPAHLVHLQRRCKLRAAAQRGGTGANGGLEVGVGGWGAGDTVLWGRERGEKQTIGIYKLEKGHE